MSKKKIVAPFLKPIAILSISTGIGATTVVLDSNNYKSPKPEKIEQTTPSTSQETKNKRKITEETTTVEDKVKKTTNTIKDEVQSSTDIEINQTDDNKRNIDSNEKKEEIKTEETTTPSSEKPIQESKAPATKNEPPQSPTKKDEGGKQ